jgi:hypothetical protein
LVRPALLGKTGSIISSLLVVSHEQEKTGMTFSRFLSVVIGVILSLSFQSCYQRAHLERDGRVDVSVDLSVEESALAEDTMDDPGIDQSDAAPDDPWDVEIPDDPAITWIRVYRGEWILVPDLVRSTRDGEYVLTSFAVGDDGIVVSVIARLDALGNVKWARMIREGSPEARGLVQTPDGGFLLAFYLNQPLSWDARTALVQIDENGTLQWARVLHGPPDIELTFLGKTSEGGFVLAGASSLDWQTDFWIAVLDAHGAFEWQKAVGEDGGSSSPYAIAQAEDGGFAAAGRTEHAGPVEVLYDTWVVKLDGSGATQWQRRITGPGMQGAFTIAQATDNGFLVGGKSRYSMSGADAFVPLLMRLDENGHILWQRKISGTVDGEILSVVPAPDGGFVAAGVGTMGSTGFDAILFKMMGDGTLGWFMSYSGADYDKFYHAEPSLDGGYIATGPTYISSPVEGHLWVVKTNGRGAGPPDCPDGLGMEMAPVVQNTAFIETSTSALTRDTDAYLADVVLPVTEAILEVGTLCESE